MAKSKKPYLLDPTPPRGKSPDVGAVPRPINWTFSFRFWRQIQFFGLDHCHPKWFVSLLEKLMDLSGEPIDAFLIDGPKKDSWRYHDISWTQKNIPIQRADAHWLAKEYRENPEEYPFVQFQISKALGRVVGFWDECQVFNVVLLDPLHNIQPTKSFDYRVNPCSPLPCIYSTLLEDVDRVKKKVCESPGCPVHQALCAVPDANHSYSVSILRMENEVAEDAQKLIDQKLAKSMEEIVFAGVIKIQDDAKTQAAPGVQFPVLPQVFPVVPVTEDAVPPADPGETAEASLSMKVEFELLEGELADGVRLIKIADLPPETDKHPGEEPQ